MIEAIRPSALGVSKTDTAYRVSAASIASGKMQIAPVIG
jgi:hypothetical protein